MGQAPSPSQIVGDMLQGYENTQLVYLAAKLGVADLLAEGPRSSDELAAATDMHKGALRRVLRGLVNRGLLAEVAPGLFGLTPLGACLKSDDPEDLRGIAVNVGDLLYGAWGGLLHSVKTGTPSFEHLHGMTWFEYLEKHPENARIFDRGMANDTAEVARAVAAAYDFSELGTVADLGGGQGILLAGILEANPSLRGVLFDAAPVVAHAPARLEARGVASRCTIVPGDFFASVPRGCDAYLMKSIIHDWSDAESIRILRNCRAAMEPSSRVLIVEPILPERVEDLSVAVEMDLGMLLLLHGRERTLAEYRALYAAAGFTLERVVETSEPFSVLEGRPA